MRGKTARDRSFVRVARISSEALVDSTTDPMLVKREPRLSSSLLGTKRPIEERIPSLSRALRGKSIRAWCATVPVQLGRQGTVHHQVSVHGICAEVAAALCS